MSINERANESDVIAATLHPPASRRFLRSAVITGIAAACIQVCGLGLNVIAARYFGATAEADTLFVTVTVGSSIAVALMSSLDAAFVPRTIGADPATRGRLAAGTLVLLGLAAAVLGLVLWTQRSWYLGLFGLGNGGPPRDLLVGFAIVVFVTTSISVVIQKTALTSALRFGWIAMSNVAGPGIALIALFLLGSRLGTLGFALALSLGALTTLTITVAGWPRESPIHRPSRGLLRPILGIASHALPLAGSSLLFATWSLVLRFIASTTGVGGISAQYYAERLLFVPHTLIAVSASAVIVPFVLNRRQPQRTAGQLLAYGLLLLSPACVLVLEYGQDVIRLVFEHGRFDEGATFATAKVLGTCIYALIPLFVTNIGWRILQADGSRLGSVAIPTSAILASSAAAFPLIAAFGLAGVGLAWTAGALAAMLLTIALLRPTRSALADMAFSASRIISAALVSAIGGALVADGLVHGEVILRLILGAVVICATFVGTCWILRVPELRNALAAVRLACQR